MRYRVQMEIVIAVQVSAEGLVSATAIAVDGISLGHVVAYV